MQELMINQKGMMSSKRIAESTGKEHKTVLRDIRSMFETLGYDGTDLYHTDFKQLIDDRGYTSEYLLNEELCICLATGYSVQVRMVLIKDWSAMKAKDAMPSNYLEALKLLVAKEEEKERLEMKVDNLSTALDSLVEWISILKVSSFNKVHEKAFDWRMLKRKSEEMGFVIKKAQSPRYGFQNLYHVNAFKACYPQYNYKFLQSNQIER